MGTVVPSDVVSAALLENNPAIAWCSGLFKRT